MSGQIGLTEEQKKSVIELLKEMKIDTDAQYSDAGEDGVYRPIHRDVILHICSYEDKTEDFDMYIQVD